VIVSATGWSDSRWLPDGAASSAPSGVRMAPFWKEGDSYAAVPPFASSSRMSAWHAFGLQLPGHAALSGRRRAVRRGVHLPLLRSAGGPPDTGRRRSARRLIRASARPYLLPEEMRSTLGRLVEIASKIRANQVRRWIAEEIDRQDLDGTLVEFNFTNGTPLIDWTTSREPGHNSAGWQYQAGQWRLTLNLRGEGLFGVNNKMGRERFDSKLHRVVRFRGLPADHRPR
jgi:hypothetical protein